MKKILTTVLLVFCFVGSAVVRQAMAEMSDANMLVPGIPGESNDHPHENWIKLISVTQTLQQDRRNPQCSVEVTKGLDRSGPPLWLAAVTGQVFREIQIDFAEVTDDRGVRLQYQIKLLNATITNISTSESSGSGIFERVTLGAGSVELLYYLQNPDGTTSLIKSSFAC